MTQTVVMAMNPLEPSSWERHEVEEPIEFLINKMGTWPATARLYDGVVCASRDITPEDESDFERLSQLRGPVYVVDYPADPVTAIVIAVVAVAALAAAAFLFRPKLPGQTPGSANNELSARTNEAQIGGRIPDIFGKVRAYPDLLTAPYRVFVANQEIEQSFMCVGRGSYQLEQTRDGETLLTSIAGASCSYYAPFTSPNSPGGASPQLSVGTPVTDPVLSVRKTNDVNGQVLRPPNFNNVTGDDDIRFVYPDRIESTGPIDLTELFSNGEAVVVSGASYNGGDPGILSVSESMRFEDGGIIRFESYDPSMVFATGNFITLTNASFAGDNGSGGVLFVDLWGTYEIASVTSTTIALVTPGAVNPDWDVLTDFPANRTEYRVSNASRPDVTSGLDLSGTFTILSVESDALVLSNPVTVNADWGTPLQDLPGSATPYLSPSIATTGSAWIGGFVIDLDNLDRVLANIVALQGLYSINNKGKQRAVSVTVEVELTPVDEDDNAIGSPEVFSTTLTGNAKSKDSIGVSLWCLPTFTGRVSVRARRTSPTNLDFSGTLVDEVKWRDLYGMAQVANEHFGDVTTVMSRTYATSGATSLKERKLSVMATRKLPQREEDGSFSTELYPTVAMADIIAFLCTDPKIGRRPSDQVDVDQVYDTQAQIIEHFGTAEAAQFCHTFDQGDTSFQDTLATVATACFSVAYRRGSLIRVVFEAPSEDSVLLFNHRNKMPGTEVRTTSFGSSSEYDGVALEYTDPKDGARLTLFVPQGDESAVNPKKISTQGISSHDQAHFLAWRSWNRIRYQTTSVEFDALPEADLLVQTSRILVADNTRPDTVDGEVVSQDVLKLRLSQRTILEDGVDYTIFLQGGGLGVDAMAVYPITDEEDEDFGDNYVVLIERAPAIDLILDDDSDFRSTYAIVRPGFERTAQPFLLSEKDPQDDGTIRLTASNYDDRYYANDKDLIDGVI